MPTLFPPSALGMAGDCAWKCMVMGRLCLEVYGDGEIVPGSVW